MITTLRAAPPNYGTLTQRETASILHLIQAISDIAGDRAAQSYFQHWTSEDVKNYFIKLSPLFKDTIRAETIHEGDVLNQWSTVYGVLGELYGASLSQTKMAQKALPYVLSMGTDLSYQFDPEFIYDLNNKYGKKHDGIGYYISGDKLVITHILESKMGSVGFDRAQLAGYIKIWQKHGIRLADHELAFKPEQIFLHISGQTYRITNPELDMHLIEQMVTVVGTADRVVPTTELDHPFAGKYKKLPFSTHQAIEIAKRFLSLLIAESRGEVLARIYREGDVELVDPLRELNEYIVKNKTWPKGGKKSEVRQRLLARYMMDEGRQAELFSKPGFLTLEARCALEQGGSLPAKFPFLQYMKRLSPSEHNEVILGFYIRAYAMQDSPENLTKSLGMVWKSVIENEEKLKSLKQPIELINTQSENRSNFLFGICRRILRAIGSLYSRVTCPAI